MILAKRNTVYRMFAIAESDHMPLTVYVRTGSTSIWTPYYTEGPVLIYPVPGLLIDERSRTVNEELNDALPVTIPAGYHRTMGRWLTEVCPLREWPAVRRSLARTP